MSMCEERLGDPGVGFLTSRWTNLQDSKSGTRWLGSTGLVGTRCSRSGRKGEGRGPLPL